MRMVRGWEIGLWEGVVTKELLLNGVVQLCYWVIMVVQSINNRWTILKLNYGVQISAVSNGYPETSGSISPLDTNLVQTIRGSELPAPNLMEKVQPTIISNFLVSHYKIMLGGIAHQSHLLRPRP